MAGDLDLARVSAPLQNEVPREFDYPKNAEPPKWDEEQLQTVDVAEQRRNALEDAIATQTNSPKGRLIIEQDDDTGRFVHKMIDPNSGEVLMQWPEEEFLELVKEMGEAYGLLVDRSV